MKCYGRYRKDKEECAACEYRPWCKDAGDISLSKHSSYDKTGDNMNISQDSYRRSIIKECNAKWMEVLRFIITVDDYRLRTIIRLKLENPDISLSQIGRYFKVTKQAIDKDIQRAVEWKPELAAILCNRPMYNRWRQKKTIRRNVPFRRKRKTLASLELIRDQSSTNTASNSR